MSAALPRFIGLAGVPPGDDDRAYLWENRLRWPMIGAALLALSALILSGQTQWRALAQALEGSIFLAFAFELAVMLATVRQRSSYLTGNWLNLAILACALLSLFGAPVAWAALGRLLRLTIFFLLFARLASAARRLTPGTTPYIVLIGLGVVLIAGWASGGSTRTSTATARACGWPSPAS
jgi:hypothetical protein